MLLSVSVICLMIATAGERGKRLKMYSSLYVVALLFDHSFLYPSTIFVAKELQLRQSLESYSLMNCITIYLRTTITITVIFKMVIDRMVPFRFVVIQLIFIASILIYSIISWVKQGYSVSFLIPSTLQLLN